MGSGCATPGRDYGATRDNFKQDEEVSTMSVPLSNGD